VETRSWFHTGAYYENDDILDRYREEYFSGLDKLDTASRPRDTAAFDLGNNEITNDDPSTMHEAHRVLRGSLLRTEVYAHDTTTEKNFTNNHAVFLNTEKDQVSYHYERIHNGTNLVDPRIQQSTTLDTDDYGNPLLSASVAYKRRQSAYAEPRALNTPFTATYLNTQFASANTIRYEDQPTNGQVQKRVLSTETALFWKDDLSGAETLGNSGARALGFESYTLALTPTLRTSLFGAGKVNSAIALEGGYRSKNGDKWVAPNSGNWWIPSGQQQFSANHFYQPIKAIDAFNEAIQIDYDPYIFFPVRITDPLNNIQEGLIDYRVLQPFLTRDINGNHSEAAFDSLGMLVGSAMMGKAGRAPSDLTNATQKKLFEDPDGTGNAPYSANNARNALKRATSRIVYELDAFQLRGRLRR